VPLIVEDAAVATALRGDVNIARTMSMFPKLTRALVGIGAWTPDGSTLRASLSDADAAAVDEAGAVADCCSVLLDADGDEVQAAGIPARCIAISGDELRRVPDVVALSAGRGKVEAIRAALRSGLIHRLVTSEDTARALLGAHDHAARAS
jgi:DNA-binding transcriptional regulator LsrR (DeoR family)